MEQKAVNKGYITDIVCVVCILLIVVSVVARFPRASQPRNYHNSDATWHMLLTIQAYRETPARVHRFLPIVTLGHENDRHIAWGATVPDAHGNFYYASFSGAGFVAPYLFFNIFRMPVTEQSLFIFNSVLYIASFVLAAKLFVKLFGKYANKHVIIILTALIYLFQPEIMHSQGIVYWHHSLFQVLLLIQLNLLFYLGRRVYYWIFMAMCVLMPSVEWTGYISNIAMMIAVLFIKNEDELYVWEKIIKPGTDKALALKRMKYFSCALIVLLTGLAGFLFLTHYLSVVSYADFSEALMSRFMARNATAEVSNLYLLRGYRVSFGWLPVITGIVLFVLFIINSEHINKIRKTFNEIICEHKGILAVMVLIIAENFLMLEHAIMYSFARMKLIFIIMLIIFTAMSTLLQIFNQRRKIVYIVAVAFFALLAITNLRGYLQREDNPYHWEAPYRIQNAELARTLNERFTPDNSLFVQSLATRGYSNLLFGRGIYYGVHTITPRLQQIALENNQQYIVFLIAAVRPWNMFAYVDYVVYDVVNERVVRNVDFTWPGVDPFEGIISPYFFFITDNNWDRGFSRLFTGFFVQNYPEHQELYQVGAYVEITENDIRRIIYVSPLGRHLHVHLEGEMLDTEGLDYPINLRVIRAGN